MTTQDITLASITPLFNTNNSVATTIKGSALATNLPTANGQLLFGNTDGTTGWVTGGGGSSLVFNGNGITGSVTPTTIAIGTSLSGSFSGSTLTLSATGSAGVPTLQQVTTAGAQTSVNTFFGAATGNSIGLTGNVNGSAPILAAVAATSGTPDANVNLFLNTVGRGTLNLCAQQANYLAVSSSAASNPFISVAGNATSMSLLHSAGGFVYIGPSAGGFVSIAGSNTGPVAISATNTNQGIGLMPMGNGATVLGNTTSASGISITGGQTSSATMTSAGAGATIDLYLHSKGSSSANYLGNDTNNTKLKISTGSDAAGTQAVFIGGYTPTQATSIDFVISTQGSGFVYLCRDTLSGIAGTSQPKLALPTIAGGTAMGIGSAGSVLTSNANTGSPFWSAPYTTGQIVLAAFTPSGAGDQLINLGTLPNTLPSDWTYGTSGATAGQFTNNSGRSRSVTVQGKVQGATGVVAPGECDLWVGFGPTAQPFANRPWQWTLTYTTASITMNPNSGGTWASGSGSPWLNFSATFDVPSGQVFGIYMFGQAAAWTVGGTPAGGFGSGSTVQITIRP